MYRLLKLLIYNWVSKGLNKTLIKRYGYTQEEINDPWKRKQILDGLEKEILEYDEKLEALKE